MLPSKIKYFFLIAVVCFTACKATKNVPEGKFLIKKNKIELIGGDNISTLPLYGIIRQPENIRFLGIKFKLAFYNAIDSTKVANKRVRLNEELRQKNIEKALNEEKINQERIEAARARNDSTYIRKTIPRKDTADPRMFFKEWVKYKLGEAPVILDTSLYNRTLDQLNNYMKRKGFYYSSTSGNIEYSDNKKAIVTYTVNAGPRYYIDSFYMVCPNSSVRNSLNKYFSEQDKNFISGQPLDADYLNSIRTRSAKHLRDDGFYGFSPSSVTFEADTLNSPDFKVVLKVNIANRLIRSEENRDSLVEVPYRVHYINKVYFHISDTLQYTGSFSDSIAAKNLKKSSGQFYTTLDTLYYDEVLRKDPVTGKMVPHPYREAYFLYNGELFVKPQIIESQNYLEHTNVYKEYYLDRSYTRLLELNVFQTVKPVFEEYEKKDSLDIHYYLMPVKRNTFGLEPRATTSNGFLGVSASINYINKNIGKSATRMTISLSGGLESQPAVFEKTVDGESIKTSARSFNTFEIGPSIKFDMPGIFPIPIKNISKRARPRTQISVGYNRQKRNDFSRDLLQTNYLWKFYVSKTQIFTVGLPTSSVIKLVRIDKSDPFEEQIEQLNDLFLRNAYSNQLIWQDIKLTYEYNDKNKDDKALNPFNKGNLSNMISFDPAGLFLSAFKNSQDTNEFGQREAFNVPYSQFVRLDDELVYAYPLAVKRSINFRFQGGFGVPYGNSKTSLPYDYSFFAGGANDNRGWRARALGPGAYKYYLDTNRTATQIGDIRIGASVEYRFDLGGPFRGALFSDVGNIWLINDDENRKGGQISNNWFNELAVAAGFGIRYDFQYFVLRVDLGIPLKNPALPEGARWITQSRQPYYDEGIEKFGANYKKLLPQPFTPVLHFGINYPF